MYKVGTITSKRQLTIPVAFFDKLGFKSNSKVTLQETKDGLLIKPAAKTMNSIAGSVKVPTHKKDISLGKAVSAAKRAHFGDDL